MKNIIKKITANHDPESIFLYGSKARGDDLPHSDTEIGVITKKDSHPFYNGVFFFDYKDFKSGKIDTPFPTDIYMRELSLSAKTIYGKKIVENFTPPPITNISLLERINFDCATALYGAKLKQEDLFYKSVLFGARNLVILRTKKFPLKYKEIQEEAEKLNLGKFDYLPEKAYLTRIGDTKPNSDDYKKSISFTNKFLREKIKDQKDKIILE